MDRLERDSWSAGQAAVLRQSVEGVGHAVRPAVGGLIAPAEGGSCFFALHDEVPVVPARHPGHVSDRDDGRFVMCGPAARFGDCHVRGTQQVSGTVPDHGCLGPFRREGTQDTSPPDVAGGDKDETERYEQESAGGVRSHLSSVHHSRGDRHARVAAPSLKVRVESDRRYWETSGRPALGLSSRSSQRLPEAPLLRSCCTHSGLLLSGSPRAPVPVSRSAGCRRPGRPSEAVR